MKEVRNIVPKEAPLSSGEFRLCPPSESRRMNRLLRPKGMPCTSSRLLCFGLRPPTARPYTHQEVSMRDDQSPCQVRTFAAYCLSISSF